MKPGDTVYSTKDCGDIFEGRHVTIPSGIQGTLVRYFYRQDPHERPHMAEIAIPDSPGQKILTCRAEEIDTFWTLDAPPPPPKRMSIWERLRENPYA